MSAAKFLALVSKGKDNSENSERVKNKLRLGKIIPEISLCERIINNDNKDSRVNELLGKDRRGVVFKQWRRTKCSQGRNPTMRTSGCFVNDCSDKEEDHGEECRRKQQWVQSSLCTSFACPASGVLLDVCRLEGVLSAAERSFVQ